jgi:hypothetical protein
MSLQRIALIGLAVGVMWPVTAAHAQPVGIYRWQLQPYCNVFTVNVTQQAGIFTLDGTDDRCGAEQAASVTGIAFQNATGLIGFGLTTVLPHGIPVHTEARIVLATLSGDWRDSAGNSGAFIYTPGAGTGGTERPVSASGVPPGSITMLQMAPGAVGSAQIAPGAVGSAQIAANAVTGARVADASLTRADILDAPRVAFAPAGDTVELTEANAPVRSVSINVQTAGTVVVNASGYFDFGAAAPAASARCSIAQGIFVDSNNMFRGGETTGATTRFVPFAGTRGFSVTAGTFTFYLACQASGANVKVEDSQMTAIFIGG